MLDDRFSATVAVLACPLALTASELVGKPLVGRPEGAGFGFPSGHTTAVATVVALVALIIYCHWHARALIWAAPIAVLLPVMSLSLVRGGEHLFSDTVAGGLLGCGTVLGLAWVVSVALDLRQSRHTDDGISAPLSEAPAETS